MRIGEKLEILRREQALTQARLRQIIGGHQSALSKILSGESGRYLNKDQILKAARHFQVTVESLLDDDMELERITEEYRAVMRQVRILGLEESFRRLNLPQASTKDVNLGKDTDPPATRFSWGQMNREDEGTEDRPRGTSGHVGA